MNIQIGEVRMNAVENQSPIYPNKTRKYLLPCLKEYGEEFTKRIEAVHKIAVGIGDIIVDKHTNLRCEKHLFILLDSYLARDFFISFLDWIRRQDMYTDDYVFGDIQKTTLHMVIIKIPDTFGNSLKSFLKGNYSKMFTEETIEKFFKDHPDIKKVLVKDNNYRITFVKELNHIWETTIEPEEYEGELDTPPDVDDEKFNDHLK